MQGEKEREREREKERDAPGHEAGESREGRSLSPFLPSLFSPPFTPAMADPRRHTGTFSHSFSVPSLTCRRPTMTTTTASSATS